MDDTNDYDVFPDHTYNANKGTERGAYVISQSLEEYGAGRSILVDKNGISIAGAKTLEQAQAMGLPVEVIESDGRTLYAIKRTDLDVTTDQKARELGIADNRASEVGLAWDNEVLTTFLDEGVELDKFWFDDELADQLAQTSGGTSDGDSSDSSDSSDTDLLRVALWMSADKHRAFMDDIRLIIESDSDIETVTDAVIYAVSIVNT